jgi:hypothetical protein
MSLVGRYKCSTHQSFLKKLTGETAIEFLTKAARSYKVSWRQNGSLHAWMMPAQVRNFGAPTPVCRGAAAVSAAAVSQAHRLDSISRHEAIQA